MGCVYTILFGVNSRPIEQFSEDTSFLTGNKCSTSCIFVLKLSDSVCSNESFWVLLYFQKGKQHAVGISMKFVTGKNILAMHVQCMYPRTSDKTDFFYHLIRKLIKDKEKHKEYNWQRTNNAKIHYSSKLMCSFIKFLVLHGI